MLRVMLSSFIFGFGKKKKKKYHAAGYQPEEEQHPVSGFLGLRRKKPLKRPVPIATRDNVGLPQERRKYVAYRCTNPGCKRSKLKSGSFGRKMPAGANVELVPIGSSSHCPKCGKPMSIVKGWRSWMKKR